MPLCRLSSSLHNRRSVQVKSDGLPVVDNTVDAGDLSRA